MDNPHHHAWSRNAFGEKSQLEMTAKMGVGTYTNRVT